MKQRHDAVFDANDQTVIVELFRLCERLDGKGSIGKVRRLARLCGVSVANAQVGTWLAPFANRAGEAGRGVRGEAGRFVGSARKAPEPIGWTERRTEARTDSHEGNGPIAGPQAGPAGALRYSGRIPKAEPSGSAESPAAPSGSAVQPLELEHQATEPRKGRATPANGGHAGNIVSLAQRKQLDAAREVLRVVWHELELAADPTINFKGKSTWGRENNAAAKDLARAIVAGELTIDDVRIAWYAASDRLNGPCRTVRIVQDQLVKHKAATATYKARNAKRLASPARLTSEQLEAAAPAWQQRR